MTTSNRRYFRRLASGSKPRRVLKLAAPVALGALFIVIVIHIMNFGGPRESLAARSETEFLRVALKKSSAQATTPAANIVIISATDADMAIIKAAPNSSLKDAHIQEYANVLEHVASQQPQWIVISWLTHAHPLTEEYLHPLTSIIDRLKIRDKVSIAANLIAPITLDPEFMREYNIVEARDCYHEVNIHWTVAPDWSWMPQQIMNRYFKQPKPLEVSTNLPHHLPNIALNLPNVHSLARFSFLDVRPPGVARIPEKAIVFIGNDAIQDVSFRNNKEVLQRTFVASSQSQRSLQADGIPWHSFWAAMTSMFIQSSVLNIAPNWLNTLVCLLSATLVLVLGFRRIDGWMIVAFVAVITGLLTFNLFSVPYMHFYLPVTPIFMTIFAALAASVFIRLSVYSYRKLRLVAAEEKAEELGDIKRNFLHVVSHNLNTPIAQLRGLLEILASDAPGAPNLERALRLTDFVRVTAKAALGSSGLRGKPRTTQNRSPNEVLGEFLDDEGSFFKRNETEISVRWPSGDLEPNIAEQPLNLDFELFTNSILFASLLILPADQGCVLSIDLDLETQFNGVNKLLVVNLKATPTGKPVIHLESLEFSKATFRRYLEIATQLGLITRRIDEHQASIVFEGRN